MSRSSLASQPLTLDPGVQPPGTWTDATIYLAGVILAAAQVLDQPVTELQRSTLLPLELTLAQSTQANPRTPDDLVGTVFEVLYPSST